MSDKAAPPTENSTYWPINSSSTPRFAGLVSFFRLPTMTDPSAVDIALVGLPWDGGTTNRAGTRHGPREVRTQSTLLRPYHHVTRTSPYEHCRVADLGDAPVNPLDITDTLRQLEAHYATLHGAGAVPITAGGDHLITLPILRALAKDGPVGLIQFDAHADVNDSYFGGQRYSHGTHVRRAIEEGLVDPKRTVQIGIRGTRYSPDGEDFSAEHGIRTINIEEVFSLGTKGVIEEIRRVVGSAPTYLTFDVDGIDPAFTPGTGTPEVGGYSVFEAQQMVRGLAGLDIIGGDVVEVSPPFDPSGVTALVGATMMFEILCVTAQATVARKEKLRR
ncbi:agmatinase [Rhizobium sp. KVB221]|uniref:Agmatinase n=1 Tax=Rhizobium setariae TaxID=2801340 RepID=A0A937CM43_9HYPH|nr:agmatinase [Rhizobium setariae]MBL0373880.1 agmatinase [Rhizobium setariae]